MKQKLHDIGTFAGATVAFFIGSGFATGQEILQYFAAYGGRFIWVIVISMAIFIYTNGCFIRAGTAGAMAHPGGIYGYFCGRWLGKFYDGFSTIFVYLSFIVMCGGAGAAVSQQFGLPDWVGIFGLSTLVALTVASGLDGLVRILGRIGPLVVLFILFIGVATVVRDFDQITKGFELIETQKVMLIHVGNSPLSAAVSYAGFVMLWFCTFMAELGNRNNPRHVKLGMGVGSAMISLALAFVSLALLANIQEVASSNIPSIILAEKISPFLAIVFAGVTLCGTYTAGVPLLWTVARRCGQEGTARFRITVGLLATASAVVALFLPYKQLVNIIYGINGYVGIALLLFLLRKDIMNYISRFHSQQTNQEGSVEKD